MELTYDLLPPGPPAEQTGRRLPHPPDSIFKNYYAQERVVLRPLLGTSCTTRDAE